MPTPRGNTKLASLLAGGRAPYYGKDAYTTQMNEYDFRRDNQFPGNLENGRLIEGLEFTAGETKEIEHFLRRNYTGFMVFNPQVRPCGFRAVPTATQGTGGQVTFDSIAGWYDYGGDYDTGTSTFTAPETGLYHVSAALHLTTSTVDGQEFNMEMIVGGATQVLGDMLWYGGPTAVGTNRVFLEQDILLSAGDTCIINSFSFPAETISTDSAKTFFSMRILGDSQPKISTASTASASTILPLFSERALTCDVWVY